MRIQTLTVDVAQVTKIDNGHNGIRGFNILTDTGDQFRASFGLNDIHQVLKSMDRIVGHTCDLIVVVGLVVGIRADDGHLRIGRQG